MPEVVDEGKTGYLISPESSNEIAEAIVSFFHQNKAEEFERNIVKENYRFSWDRMIDVIESLVLPSNHPPVRLEE